MKTLYAKLAFEAQAELGEGPLWQAERGTLYVVDITKGTVFGYHPNTAKVERWQFPNYVSALASTTSNRLLVVEQQQLSTLNPTSGSTEFVQRFEMGANLRFNECKCDRLGRFWMGTMHLEAQQGQGAFYRVDLDGTSTEMLSTLTIPNGFCWTQDDRYLYHIDSFSHQVLRYDFELSTGTLGHSKAVYESTDPSIYLDGMCIDQHGNLWIACWGGGKVICVDPTLGKIVAQVDVPVPQVTSCVFGGVDYSTLYITTAYLGLTPKQREESPLSGAVFSCDVGVPGTATSPCQLKI